MKRISSVFLLVAIDRSPTHLQSCLPGRLRRITSTEEDCTVSSPPPEDSIETGGGALLLRRSRKLAFRTLLQGAETCRRPFLSPSFPRPVSPSSWFCERGRLSSSTKPV